MNKILQAILLFPCLLVATTGNPLTLQAQQVGNQCSVNSGLSVQSFTVDPWPPVLGQNFIYTTQITFSQSVSMNYYAIGTNFNHNTWNYKTYPNVQTFQPGDIFGATEQMPAGTSPGNYVQQFTMHNSQNQIVACWQFDYYVT